MMIVVPVEEVYVEALQVKYPIIDGEVYSKDTRKYWKIIRVRNHTEAYQAFDDMLKKFDRDDLDKNSILVNFCDVKGISQTPYTPEQNGVAERKNKTLIEATRIMLSRSIFSKQYWTEAVATACYTQNSTEAIKFSKPLVDDINIAELERYPPDEYLHTYEHSQRYQVDSNVVQYIEPYKKPEPIIADVDASLDQNDQAAQNHQMDQNDQNDQNDHPVQADEILTNDHLEHSNHNNDNHIINNLPNTKDVQIT
ncbi:retrovirus-related pol polyprotein from transposon TNT 1-94 [Tanacetum coccineum]